jgi:hypothetical protein
MGFWLEDQEGDVYDVNLDSFDIDDKYLIHVSDDMAVFELNSTFSFTTEVEYDDYETAVYDSEEKVAIPWRRIEKRVEKSMEIPIEITISFKESDPKYLEIEDLALNNGNDIGITVDEHPYYDLK